MATAKKASTAGKATSGSAKKSATPAKKSAAKAPAKGAGAKKSAPPAKKSAPAPKKAPAPAKKATPAAKTSPPASSKKAPAPTKASTAKASTAKASTAKAAPAEAPKPAVVTRPVAKGLANKPAPAKKAAPPRKAGKVVLDKFQLKMRDELNAERETYLAQAESLRAEADQIALEAEPGDIQFDDESGEGGTMAIDREPRPRPGVTGDGDHRRDRPRAAEAPDGHVRDVRELRPGDREGAPRGVAVRPSVHRLQERRSLASLTG